MNPFRWSFRNQFLLGFAICAALLGYAFYVQFQLGILPCPFCIFQRLCFAALGIVFLLGALHAPRAPGARKGWSLLALVAGISRTALAMARERDLPGPLGAVSQRHRVPWAAELAVAGLVGVSRGPAAIGKPYTKE